MDGASNPVLPQFRLKKKNHVSCIPAEDLYSNCPREFVCQAYDKADFTAVLKSSLSRNTETLPELRTFHNSDQTKIYQDQVSLPHPEKTLASTGSLSKETSGEKDPVSKGNQMVKNGSSYGNSLPKHAESTGINSLSFSHEIESAGKTSVLKDTSKSIDATKCPTCAANLDATILDGHIYLTNAKEVLPMGSLASPFGKPNFKTDASSFVSESNKIPEFRCNGEKNLRHSMSVNTKMPDDESAITSRGTSSNHLLFNKSFNKPLKEILKVFEDWAKRGLDVFNRSVTLSSEEIETNLAKDLEYGLDIMKEMNVRIYTLIRAASQLLDIDSILIPEFQTIRGDFNKTLMEMWSTIEFIEIQVCGDYRKIKLSCDNVSVKSNVGAEQRSKPNIFITNAYAVAIQKLPLLWKQSVDVCDKIRIIFSEIKKLL